MTQQQIEALAAQLALLAAAVVPGQAGNIAALRGLITAGTTLHGLIAAIREEDPAAWDAVSADFNSSLAGFQDSVRRQQAAQDGDNGG